MAIILGIETSCDETSAGILIEGNIAADVTSTQTIHQKYGGVVPELASRAHEKLLTDIVSRAVKTAGISMKELDAVAVTYGPGLAGALLIGVSFAKGLASMLGIPFIGVNHLEGHLWVGELEYDDIQTPFLALLISGGHTILLRVDGFRDYHLLGTTRDDAVGELLDKVGRMLGLDFPAGSEIDRLTTRFSGKSVSFPRAKLSNDPYGFSFSGLKTSVLYYLRKNYSTFTSGDGIFQIPLDERNSILKGMMESVGDMLSKSIEAALSEDVYGSLVVGGGVSASSYLRRRFEFTAKEFDLSLHIPTGNLCTDNGIMIAHIGNKLLQNMEYHNLDLEVQPSLSLF